MPPRSKFTKEEIIKAALEITIKDGIEALTARSLAEQLKSSPRPIFTVFANMGEVQDAVISETKKIYTSYIVNGLSNELAFKGVGEAYIKFSNDYPKLFMLLFMKEKGVTPNPHEVLGVIEDRDNYDKILDSIINGYHLSREKAIYLYTHLWIYSHGIAVLIATRVCKFTHEEVSTMLTQIFVSLLKQVLAEEK